jgi:hypothetical protein
MGLANKRAAKISEFKAAEKVVTQSRVIATYAVGEIREGNTGQPFVYRVGGEAHVECLKDICTQMGGRPVGFVNVQLKDGKPQYMYTYFYPKHGGCAGCTGEVHEPKNAADVIVMMIAIDFIMKGSNGTGVLPGRAEAESNFAAAATQPPSSSITI